MSTKHLDKIVSLCKRKGFVFPNSEIYGGLKASYDYGPLGVELKSYIRKMVESNDEQFKHCWAR